MTEGGIALKLTAQGITELKEELQNKLAARLQQVGHQKTMYAKIAVYMHRAIQQNFITEGARIGGWKRLSPVTIARRRLAGAGAKKLRDTGLLMNSCLPSWTNQKAEVGTNLIYARAMQFGLPQRTGHFVSKKGKAFKQRLPPVPARPFLKLNNEDIGKVIKIVETYIGEGK